MRADVPEDYKGQERHLRDAAAARPEAGDQTREETWKKTEAHKGAQEHGCWRIT